MPEVENIIGRNYTTETSDSMSLTIGWINPKITPVKAGYWNVAFRTKVKVIWLWKNARNYRNGSGALAVCSPYAQ